MMGLPDKVICPVCWGTGTDHDVCTLCPPEPGGAVGTGWLKPTQESVKKMFRWAAEAMANIEYQGPSERLAIPLGWQDGDYDYTPSENARRVLINAEAMIVMAVAIGLADQLNVEGVKK